MIKNYRRLPLTNAYNVRDMGGYPCREGMTRYHRLYRADSPHMLSEDEWKLLFSCGVRSVIDLRSYGERQVQCYETAGTGIRVISLPMQKEDMDFKNMDRYLAESGFMHSMMEGYTNILSKNKERIAEILNCVCGCLPEGAVLFHCTAGKDRTGILAALVYLLCGVESADIVADYQVSVTYNQRNLQNKMLGKGPADLLDSRAETMWELLGYIEEQQVIESLYKNGLNPECGEILTHYFVEKEHAD
ncbi:tyrosine-protein phosphatase [Anaerolentibacter hominis]|uniref:tyrosine-protein phosphatase n=1 Tax=Anaerolentibacter hominis TaxID=3079009 RepID=UPI0031B8193D